jgi:quinol monooxygenase YgiN
MVTVGFLIRYEAKPGKEAEVERALKSALATIQKEPATIAWFAVRLGPSTFGVEDAYSDEEGRQMHLSVGGRCWRRTLPNRSHNHPSLSRLTSLPPSSLRRGRGPKKIPCFGGAA